MSYVSFSLKYRPQRFADVVGQEHVSRTLMNAVRTGRVAHAYLFAGPRGTGKTSSARVLAKALNCARGPTPEPCGTCDFCRAVQEGRALDVIEIDAASNRGIDEIRDLREKVKYSPAQARYKVYILDEVHMLTVEAFNALLKTLEEPPAHSFFVLATTEPHRVPATIMSRCQRFDFRPIPVPKIVEALERIAHQEGVSAEPAALEVIARAADGAMRDAQSILDQVVAYTDGAVTLEVVNSVLGVTEAEILAEIADLMVSGDVAGSFSTVDRVAASGKDVAQLLADLALYLRDLLRISLGGEPSAWRLPGEEGRERITSQAHALSPDRLMEAVRTVAQAQNELRSSSQHSLLLELTLARLCQPVAPPQPRPPQRPPQGTPPVPAPPPAASPAPPAPARPLVTGELTLETIAANWDKVPVELKRMGRLPVGAFVREATPTSLEGDVLTVTFDARYVFHHDQVSGAYRPVIEEALGRVFGRPLTLRCRLGSPAETSPQPAEASEAAPEPAPEPPAEPAAGPAAQPAGGEPLEAAVTPQPEPPGTTEAPEPRATAAEPAAPSAVDLAVQRTLSLFEGSHLLEEEE